MQTAAQLASRGAKFRPGARSGKRTHRLKIEKTHRGQYSCGFAAGRGEETREKKNSFFDVQSHQVVENTQPVFEIGHSTWPNEPTTKCKKAGFRGADVAT